MAEKRDDWKAESAAETAAPQARPKARPLAEQAELEPAAAAEPGEPAAVELVAAVAELQAELQVAEPPGPALAGAAGAVTLGPLGLAEQAAAEPCAGVGVEEPHAGPAILRQKRLKRRVQSSMQFEYLWGCLGQLSFRSDILMQSY